MYCNQCGHELYPGKFCSNCGEAAGCDGAVGQTPMYQAVGCAMPVGVMDFSCFMRAFCDAVTSWRNISIISSGVNVLLGIISAVLARHAGIAGYSLYTGAEIFSRLIGLAIGIAFAVWVSWFILKPIHMLEGSCKYFSQFTYEKKMRFGMTFSGRVKFIYVWSIIAIVSVGITVFISTIALFANLKYAEYLGFMGWWGYLFLPIIEISLLLVLSLSAAIQIIKAYKDFRPTFGLVTMADHYAFAQISNTYSGAYAPSASAYDSTPRNSDWMCPHCKYPRNPPGSATCGNCGKYR